MTHDLINWNDTETVILAGESIRIPTYGDNGGPSHTTVDSTSLATIKASGTYKDALDVLYLEHDKVYATVYFDNVVTQDEMEALAIADIDLINSIIETPDSALEGEAHLYAAGTELALLYNIIVNYDQAELLTLPLLKAIVSDAIDSLKQAEINPELTELGGFFNFIGQFTTFDFAGVLEDAAAELPKSYSKVLTSPKIDDALTDALFDFSGLTGTLLSTTDKSEDLAVPLNAQQGFVANEEATSFLALTEHGPEAGHFTELHKGSHGHSPDFLWA